MKKPNELNLSVEELQIISDLDSRQFGFINWNNSENYILRDLVRRAISALQNIISLSESNNYETLCTSEIEVKSSSFSIKTEDYEAIPPIFEFPDMNNINVKVEEKLKIDTGHETNHRVDLETYCKVGHLHLILEEYNEALSAYQKYFKMKPTNLNNLEILYGLGLVYFHFNAFRCANFNYGLFGSAAMLYTEKIET